MGGWKLNPSCPRSCQKLERGNLSTYFDISKVSRTYQLILTYLYCRKRSDYGVSNLWNLLQESKVFWLILFDHVRVGLKCRQCFSENTDRVQHSLSRNNQDNNQDKSFSVCDSSLTCDHPSRSKSSTSKSIPSPSLWRSSTILYSGRDDHSGDKWKYTWDSSIQYRCPYGDPLWLWPYPSPFLLVPILVPVFSFFFFWGSR